MNSAELLELFERLVGQAPEGLEWLAYLMCCLLVFFGLFIILSILSKFFSIFDKR